MQTDADHVLVFNGEIYNFRELAVELGIRAASDTQVLYEIGRRGQWDKWIHRLRGMWAFVHYDKTTETLTAARDPFGIKPLFTRQHHGGHFSIGSTVAALAELPGGSLTPGDVAIAGFLASGVFSEGTSAFDQIAKLEPGVLRVWRQTERGWMSSARSIQCGEWPSNPTPAAIRDSVASHMVADVEVGVLLSGGVDSTLLAAIAADLSPQIRTFSLINPENPDIDEGALARHNALLLGSIHVEVPVTATDLAGRADALVRSTGEPFSDAAYLPLSALSEVVAQHVKVALAGEGADELYGGYRRYDIERMINSPVLGPWLRAVARAANFDERWPHPDSQRKRVLVSSSLRSEADRHSALMYGQWPQVRRSFRGGEDAHRAFLTRWTECSMDPCAVAKPANQAFDLREWLPNVFLEKSDRASMLHSLEVRTPFLDPLVARAASEYFPRNSRKQVLRDELRRLLPGVVLPHRKMGLGVDVPSLVGRHYADLIRRTLLDGESVLRKIGLYNEQPLLQAVHSSPTFAFRVAMVGLWQENWL